jgi:ATP-dependent Clp protease ATP-binding subunit ClpA
LAEFHGVAIDADVLPAVVERSLSLPGQLPGTAVSLLDAATARATLEGSTKLDLCHVYLAAAPRA